MQLRAKFHSLSFRFLSPLYFAGFPGLFCNYNNQQYIAGQSFPSTDGCNTCRCSGYNRVACTKRDCLPDKRKSYSCNYEIFESPHEITNNLHMRKQRRLCFRYRDSTILLLSKSKISSF